MSLLEQVEAFWNRRPCNVRHSTKPVGTKEYFDETETRRYFVEPHIRDFAQFERWRGKKVLELGCGIGIDSLNFARAGADLTVIDYSEKSLEICKQRFAVNGLQAKFYHGNIEELGKIVPIQAYDLIYSFGVIHHTPNPERVIEEIKKYTDPKTEIRLMLYACFSWKMFWVVLKFGYGNFFKMRELVQKYAEAQTGCPVAYSYSFREIRQLLKDFEITALWKDHIFPYKIEPYIRHEYQKNWYFKIMPAPLFRWLKKRLGWHALIVAKPDTTKLFMDKSPANLL